MFTPGQVFFAESVGTSVLVFNVLSTIDIPTEGGGPLGVFPIAMSVLIAHLFLLPIDGCSINPSRSFGPSLVATWAGIHENYYSQQYIFWFGPLFGAAIAAIFYEYLGLKPDNFAGAKDMDTAIFQANKKRQHFDDPSAIKPDSYVEVPMSVSLSGSGSGVGLGSGPLGASHETETRQSRSSSKGHVTFQVEGEDEGQKMGVESSGSTVNPMVDQPLPSHASSAGKRRPVSPPPPAFHSVAIDNDDEDLL